MQLAAPCRCLGEPQVFEPGWCHGCGHLLEVELGHGGDTDGWDMLDAAVELRREKVRDRAEAEGVDLEDRDAYLGWLEVQLGEPVPA